MIVATFAHTTYFPFPLDSHNRELTPSASVPNKILVLLDSSHGHLVRLYSLDIS